MQVCNDEFRLESSRTEYSDGSVTNHVYNRLASVEFWRHRATRPSPATTPYPDHPRAFCSAPRQHARLLLRLLRLLRLRLLWLLLLRLRRLVVVLLVVSSLGGSVRLPGCVCGLFSERGGSVRQPRVLSNCCCGGWFSLPLGRAEGARKVLPRVLWLRPPQLSLQSASANFSPAFAVSSKDALVYPLAGRSTVVACQGAASEDGV
eukprot:COSAG02_NODE_3255_length_7085_cov_8.518609_3_plen_205_part_00